jgi:hypothetical protein
MNRVTCMFSTVATDCWVACAAGHVCIPRRWPATCGGGCNREGVPANWVTFKTYAEPKPLGTATFEPIRAVGYLDDEDIFEVEFESGETVAVPHQVIRRANDISNTSREVDSVWIEAEVRAGFLIRYKDGGLADCVWDFVKETA